MYLLTSGPSALTMHRASIVYLYLLRPCTELEDYKMKPGGLKFYQTFLSHLLSDLIRYLR